MYSRVITLSIYWILIVNMLFIVTLNTSLMVVHWGNSGILQHEDICLVYTDNDITTSNESACELSLEWSTNQTSMNQVTNWTLNHTTNWGPIELQIELYIKLQIELQACELSFELSCELNLCHSILHQCYTSSIAWTVFLNFYSCKKK